MGNFPTDASEESLGKITTVAGSILDQYFDALEKVEGYEKVAERLRRAVAEKGVGNEAAIKAALFDDSTP